MRFTVALVLVLAGTAWPAKAYSSWDLRIVDSVAGTFTNFTPPAGYEVGIGTHSIKWGYPVTGGTHGALEWQGLGSYFPTDEGEWVYYGDSFLAGWLFFHNGEVQNGSFFNDTTVDWNIAVWGTEYDGPDERLLSVSATLNLTLRQTPNLGLSPEADADYLYFTDFPNCGSVRVYEEGSVVMPVYCNFGSVEPAFFGDPLGDGFWNPSVADIPQPSIPEPTSLVLWSLGVALIAVRRRRNVA